MPTSIEIDYNNMVDPQKGLVPYLASSVKRLIVTEDVVALQKLVNDMAQLAEDLWSLIDQVEPKRQEYERKMNEKRALEAELERNRQKLAALEAETNDEFGVVDATDDIDSFSIDDLVNTTQAAEQGFIFGNDIDALAVEKENEERERKAAEEEANKLSFDFGPVEQEERTPDEYIPLADIQNILAGATTDSSVEDVVESNVPSFNFGSDETPTSKPLDNFDEFTVAENDMAPSLGSTAEYEDIYEDVEDVNAHEDFDSIGSGASPLSGAAFDEFDIPGMTDFDDPYEDDDGKDPLPGTANFDDVYESTPVSSNLYEDAYDDFDYVEPTSPTASPLDSPLLNDDMFSPSSPLPVEEPEPIKADEPEEDNLLDEFEDDEFFMD